MLGSFGWSSGQLGCLNALWSAESGWNVYATNPSSGAYGIPQALPGAKMASAGPDWQSDPATQIRWGLRYIRSVYGSPCGAWGHETSQGWY
jgi:transglycosylase-like protein with SLT domain